MSNNLNIHNIGYRYYVRDYLGSTRAVLAEDGTLLQDANYYPGGLSFSQLNDTEETDRLHCGKEWVDMEGLGWYDNTARFHDAILCRFTTPDPLAEQYPDLSPYSHCANNPLTIVDPDGRVLRDADGNIVYKTSNQEVSRQMPYYKTNDLGNTEIASVSVRFRIGYVYANDNSPILVYSNLSGDPRWDTNCHGTTFLDGQYWLEFDALKLIASDYNEVPMSDIQSGDKIVYGKGNNPAYHSSTIVEILGDEEYLIDVFGQDGYEVENTVKPISEDKADTESYRFFRGSSDKIISDDEINQLPIP